MNAVTAPAAKAPQFEEGYYQWVPLAPGEKIPPEDDGAAGVAHPAATRLDPQEMGASPSFAAPPEGGRGDLAQPAPLPLAGGADPLHHRSS